MSKQLVIPLYHIQPGLELKLYAQTGSKLSSISEEEALSLGEAPYQLREGHFYEYVLSQPEFRLSCATKGIVIPSQIKDEAHKGRIQPNIYVGTLQLNVDGPSEGQLWVEVLSTKFTDDGLGSTDAQETNRLHYRAMLEAIAAKCSELLMQLDAPVNQLFDSDFDRTSATLYQRFAFVRASLNEDFLEAAVGKIIANPKTRWVTHNELADIRSVRRFSAAGLRELSRNANRMKVPEGHPLRHIPLDSVPVAIQNPRKYESVDTPENRIVKYILTELRDFMERCCEAFPTHSRAGKEALWLGDKLNAMLEHGFFKEIGRPTNLRINSPVLQRRSGYRELLQMWLRSQVASQLTWEGGDLVYSAGKRDIATLYEYWLFFKLHDLVAQTFGLEDGQLAQKLLSTDTNGVHILLKSGRQTIIEGISSFSQRKLRVRFSYNRSFAGNKPFSDRVAGSYTLPMIPDYTVSVWPAELQETEAERLEDIVHIHFDAKYKVRRLLQPSTEEEKVNAHDSQGLGDGETPEEIQQYTQQLKEDERKGIYKNVDLFKMHAYKDAIRRTAGAYILYPGENAAPDTRKGFHEILPGLGAFAMNPANEEQDAEALSAFLQQVAEHLISRTTQREQKAGATYRIFNSEPEDFDASRVEEPFTEYIAGKKLIPHQTRILVGLLKSAAHKSWVEMEMLYNFRADAQRRGSVSLTSDALTATYLLLYEKGKANEAVLYRRKDDIHIWLKEDLQKKHYPNPNGKTYLVVELELETDVSLQSLAKRLGELNQYTAQLAVGKPFVIGLEELVG